MLFKTLTSSLTGVAALGLCLPQAMAQPTTAGHSRGAFPYVTLQMGIGFPSDVSGSLDESAVDLDTTFSSSPGFNGELGVGYRFSDSFRSDVTVGYGTYGGVKQTLRLPGVSSATLDADGRISLLTAMLNGYVDVPIRNGSGALSRWSPYLGGGIGYANITLPDCSFSADCFKGGSASGFAYQGKAGLSYRATERGFAFLEGAYTGATGPSIDGVDFGSVGGWRVNLGWRQGFGGAPAAVKATPQAAAPEVEPAPAPVATPQPAPAPQPQAPIRGLW